MDSRTRMTFAVGVAAGYVVGRNNKERLALGLLSLATGRALDSMSLIGQGMRKLAESRQFEQLGESLTSVLEQQTRSLLESQADDGEPKDEASRADVVGAEDSSAEETDRVGSQGSQAAEEPDEEEVEPPQPSAHRSVRREKSQSPSPHKAGPKNPPAAKAKAMGSKARAARASRRPGPQNPPAAKAMARKAAGKKADAERAAGKTSPARSSRRR